MPFKDKQKELEYERTIYRIKRKQIRAYQNKWKRENQADLKYYQANRAKILEDKKRYYQENKAAIAERKRVRYLKDKEKRLRKFLAHKKYERAHPDRVRKYYQDNAAKILAKQKTYREQKKQLNP